MQSIYNEEALLKTFLTTLLKLENVERGSIWVHRDNKIVCIEATGDQRNNIKGMEIDPEQASIVGWVIENGKRTISRPSDDGRHFSEIENDLAVKSTVILCFPLIMENGSIYGAIQLIDTSLTGQKIDLRREYLELIENLIQIGSLALSKFIDYHVQLSENRKLSQTLSQLQNENPIIGNSPTFLDVLKKARDYARADFPVLILGESGTGKEVMAREIYRLSTRKHQPFYVRNCSAIPDTLLESELFGHKKGAFTGATQDKKGVFEAADGGMLFLDEIGDMPFPLQARILRVIQSGEIKPLGSNVTRHVDVRVISATNVDLADAVKKKEFREDLYYRLNVLPLTLPPLRERKEDIPALLDFFLNKECHRMELPTKKITPDANKLLTAYPWKGNVRELENFVKHIIVVCKSTLIDTHNLPRRFLNSSLPLATPPPASLPAETEKPKTTSAPPAEIAFTDYTWGQLEKAYVMCLLEKVRWNVTKAAKLAGLNRSTFNSRMRKLGIEK